MRALQVRQMAYTFLNEREKANADRVLYNRKALVRLWNAWPALKTETEKNEFS